MGTSNIYITLKKLNLTKNIICLAWVAITLLIISLFYSSASAYVGNLRAPFDIGTSWNVCQGYDNPRGTHNNSSRISLDLTGSGCDNSASGRSVRSPLSGTVSWYVQTSGSLCVSFSGGKSMMFTHINSSFSSGVNVTEGQIIGTVAAPGQRQNNGVAHLHLQAWSSSNCTGVNSQIPLDSTNGLRLCGTPNMRLDGPNNYSSGTWSSTKFITSSCNTSIPASSQNIYRFYSPVTKHHLFTADDNEANILSVRGASSWTHEGNAHWVKSVRNCLANESIYRFYSEVLKVHLLTNDENERRELSKYPSDMWRYEGVAYCAERTATSINRPVYRFYSDYLQSPHYTTDENERRELSKYPSDMWRYEGVAYYAY